MEFVLPHFSHSCLKPYHHDMKVLFQMALSNQIRFFSFWTQKHDCILWNADILYKNVLKSYPLITSVPFSMVDYLIMECTKIM